MKVFFLVLCFLLLTVIFVDGQIIDGRPVAGVNSNTDATTYSFTSFTPTAGSVLVVFVVATGTVQTNPTITSTGTILTWVREATQIISGTGYYIFWARVPKTVSITTITFNCTTDPPNGISMSLADFIGVNPNKPNPVLQTKISTVATVSANANISFDNPLRLKSGYLIGWSGLFLTNNNSIPPAGFTECDDMGRTTPARSLATARRGGGLSTAGPFVFTNASTTWVALGIEIEATRSVIPISLLY